MKKKDRKDILAKLKDVSTLSDQEIMPDFVSTGSYALNKIISGKYDGGIPIGSITQFIGKASTAKTVFGTHILREAQKKDYYSIIIDSENAYNPDFAVALGIDPDILIYDAPQSVEDCFDKIDKLVEQIREEDSDTPIVVFYDSIAVSPSKAEMEADTYDMHNMQGAIRAKATGGCLRKMNPMLRSNKVALVVVNQHRSKAGFVMGDPRTPAAGGNALDYYLGVNIECNTTDLLGDKHSPFGIRGLVKNLKNKIVAPFKKCEFELIFNQGLNPLYGVLPLLELDGIVERNGAWYTVVATGKKFQSKDLANLIDDEGMKPIKDVLS